MLQLQFAGVDVRRRAQRIVLVEVYRTDDVVFFVPLRRRSLVQIKGLGSSVSRAVVVMLTMMLPGDRRNNRENTGRIEATRHDQVSTLLPAQCLLPLLLEKDGPAAPLPCPGAFRRLPANHKPQISAVKHLPNNKIPLFDNNELSVNSQ